MNKYVVALISAIIGFFFVSSPELDLIRYYEYVETFDTKTPILDFILDNFHNNLDFIYYLAFFIIKNIGLNKEIVTALFMGLFYGQIIYFLILSEKIFKVKSKINLVLIEAFAIFSVTPIYTLTISRNAAALSIFFTGLCFLIQGKNIKTTLFFIFSMFTHVVMIVYLLLFVIFYNLNITILFGRKNRNILLIVMTFIGLKSKQWIDVFFEYFLTLPIFTKFTRYGEYFEKDELTGLNKNNIITDSLSYTDTIPIFYNAMILLIGLMIIKKYNHKIIWTAYFFYIFLVISLGFSTMWTERIIMLLMPFQGVVALAVLSENNNNKNFIFIYKTLITFSVIMCFLNLYSYREVLRMSF